MSHRIFGALATFCLLVACGSSKAGSSSSGSTTGGSSGTSTSSGATTTGGTSGRSSTTLGSGGSSGATSIGTTGGSSGSSTGASTTSTAGGSSSGAPVLAVQPSTATLLTGDTLTFNPLNGVGTVAWQATLGSFTGSLYTAPAAAGTDTVTATDSSGAKATATVTIVAGTPIYSGSVSYAGSKTGWIFVFVPSIGSTAINSPGSFEIRGPVPCGYSPCTGFGANISAYMDVLGTGSYDAAVDPAATLGVSWPTGANSIALALQDPTAAAPDQAPTYVEVYPSSGGAFVTWVPLTSGTSVLETQAEVADSYKVYASAAADLSNPVATQVVQATVFHGTSLTGLTTGSSLYFGVSALLAGQEGPLSMPVGPITIGGVPGGHAITGTLDVAGPVAFGPAYVLAYTASPIGGYTGATYFTQVTPVTASQAYTIEGVPDGTYTVAAFLDQGVSGTLAPGDPSTLGQVPAASSLVTLSGADVAGPTLTLTDNPSVATAVTGYFAQQELADPHALRPSQRRLSTSGHALLGATHHDASGRHAPLRRARGAHLSAQPHRHQFGLWGSVHFQHPVRRREQSQSHRPGDGRLWHRRAAHPRHTSGGELRRQPALLQLDCADLSAELV